MIIEATDGTPMAHRDRRPGSGRRPVVVHLGRSQRNSHRTEEASHLLPGPTLTWGCCRLCQRAFRDRRRLGPGHSIRPGTLASCQPGRHLAALLAHLSPEGHFPNFRWPPTAPPCHSHTHMHTQDTTQHTRTCITHTRTHACTHTCTHTA